MNLSEKFVKEFQNFLDNFGKENNCVVSFRLPKFYEVALQNQEIDTTGVTIIPVFLEKEHNILQEKVEE